MTDKLWEYIKNNIPDIPAGFAGGPSSWYKECLLTEHRLGKIPEELKEEVEEFTKINEKPVVVEHEYQCSRIKIKAMIPGSDGMGNAPVYKEYILGDDIEMGG